VVSNQGSAAGLGVRGDRLLDCFSLLLPRLSDCTDPCTDEPKAISLAVLSERGGGKTTDTAAGNMVTEAGTDDVASDAAVGEVGLELAQFDRDRPAVAVCCGKGRAACCCCDAFTLSSAEGSCCVAASCLMNTSEGKAVF